MYRSDKPSGKKAKHARTEPYRRKDSKVKSEPDGVVEEEETVRLQKCIQQVGDYGFHAWIHNNQDIPMQEIYGAFGKPWNEDLASRSLSEHVDFLRKYLRQKVIFRRPRLSEYYSIDDAVSLIQKSSNILVLTGAEGISVACGIPDFRSENGIYSLIPDLDDPQQMFDIDYFKESPETFYSFASQFTVPLPPLLAFLVERVTTTVMKCSKCKKGLVKPDIVFFGEKTHLKSYLPEDAEEVDLLIVIGSSLRIAPVSLTQEIIPRHVPQILINLEILPHMEGFDIQLKGECDIVLYDIAKRLGWEELSENSKYSYAIESDIESPHEKLRLLARVILESVDGALFTQVCGRPPNQPPGHFQAKL
ncbi:NAD-dependent protein deacetylase sirtuin-1 [Phlyctochytrium planicorne]|nr:NAD-dependent protein deacetylase sirtuin-1 [Phlyctochytrium planicorne]